MGEGQILKLFNLDNIRYADTEGREGHRRTQTTKGHSVTLAGIGAPRASSVYLPEVART